MIGRPSEAFEHHPSCHCGRRGFRRIIHVGDCWSVAPMRGMLSLQCTWVPCYPLPRTRIIEHRDITGQLADERSEERRVGKEWRSRWEPEDSRRKRNVHITE